MEDLKNKKPLSHAPTAAFTMHRDDFKKNEDLRLVSHFASWISKVADKPVTEENFEDDLLDGVALCRLMAKIEGSGMGSFHEPKSETMDAFKAKENMVFFQNATKALNLPISFGTEDLEKKHIGRIVSTLIFIAHTAHAQGVTVADMDKEILDKVEEMDQELDDKVKGAEAGSEDAPWWHGLLQKLGLGEWIDSMNMEAIKAYMENLKVTVQAKLKGGDAAAAAPEPVADEAPKE